MKEQEVREEMKGMKEKKYKIRKTQCERSLIKLTGLAQKLLEALWMQEIFSDRQR
jgi:hypothetical protein